jgi:serine/threonine-protein kinase
MEYIEGKHLKQLLRRRGSLTVKEVIDIMLQITDGMAAAHDSYIIHRDIKPQNIMILENGLVKITDFGIAMALNGTQLTQTNSVMGSVHYLPPEQASGKGSTIQSDIYSMGILMYELLTGKLPYKGDNAVEIALKHLKESLPSIRKELPNLPQSIENIILKAAAKNPKNRYADAREMHDDIKTCLEESRQNEEPYVYKYSESDETSKKERLIMEEVVPIKAKEKSKENVINLRSNIYWINNYNNFSCFITT